MYFTHSINDNYCYLFFPLSFSFPNIYSLTYIYVHIYTYDTHTYMFTNTHNMLSKIPYTTK